MKKIFLFLLLILFIQPTLACNVQLTLDLQNGSEQKANKILYEYILEDLKMTPEQVKEFANIDTESVKAYEVDLNIDGEKEIIGVCYSTLYWGTAGFHLFILHKNNNRYENIIYALNFEPQKDLKVLQSKHNGYYDLKLSGSNAYNFKTFIAKYKDGFYQNIIQVKSLENALRQ